MCLIKTPRIIPDSERWLHEGASGTRVDKAIAWAADNAPAETAWKLWTKPSLTQSRQDAKMELRDEHYEFQFTSSLHPPRLRVRCF